MNHDPILVPAAKFGDRWDLYWRYWCPCGKGGSVQTYEAASVSAVTHAQAKGGQGEAWEPKKGTATG